MWDEAEKLFPGCREAWLRMWHCEGQDPPEIELVVVKSSIWLWANFVDTYDEWEMTPAWQYGVDIGWVAHEGIERLKNFKGKNWTATFSPRR